MTKDCCSARWPARHQREPVGEIHAKLYMIEIDIGTEARSLRAVPSCEILNPMYHTEGHDFGKHSQWWAGDCQGAGDWVSGSTNIPG